MRIKRLRAYLAGSAILAAAPLFLAAAEPAANGEAPLHRVTVAFQYPGVILTPEDTVSIDLLLKNRGRSDETVRLEVTEKPANWEAQLKKYSTVVSGVFVASKEDQTLTLSAKPAGKDIKKLPPGTYRVAVKATTEDGTLNQTAATTITVVGQEKAGDRISVETSYPVLRGPSTDKFEFSLDVRNDTDQDAVFNFRATAPTDWETSFKPSYEQKQISSLQIKANESKTVEFQVTPPYNVQAGEYSFKVDVQTPKAKTEKELKVVVTGTYSIKAGTPNGLLSVVTERGQKTTVSILVQNKGSAPQREIKFSAFKPENWKAQFKPEKVENVEPGGLKQTEMTITPGEQALVGDYSVSVQVEGEKGNADLELRVTIKAATTWGWIGIGLIVAVVVGLALMFRVLGRR